MKKSYKIIMLPTKNKSYFKFLTKKGKEVFDELSYFEKEMSNILDSGNQHLYILDSKAKIKKDDWIITTKTVTEQLCTYKIREKEVETIKIFPDVNKGKIIASTDKTLSLPTIPQSYIKYFVEEWNKENKIKEVELELAYKKDNFPKEIIDILKVENNEVCPIIPLSLEDRQNAIIAFELMSDEDIDFSDNNPATFTVKEVRKIANDLLIEYTRKTYEDKSNIGIATGFWNYMKSNFKDKFKKDLIVKQEEKINKYYSKQYQENQGIQSIEEAAKEYVDKYYTRKAEHHQFWIKTKKAFLAGAKYQEDININLIESSQNTAIKSFELNAKLMNLVNTMYSQKEVMSLIETAFKDARNSNINVKEWFNQFKKE